jgi:hypothetical protein
MGNGLLISFYIAAMRLRQLGTTQAISFFIPPEVHQSIADLQNKTMHECIDSSDV